LGVSKKINVSARVWGLPCTVCVLLIVWNQSESCHLPHELAGDKGREELGTMDEELWMIPSFEIKKKIHSPQGISKMNG
jgi:hypothetical protein